MFGNVFPAVTGILAVIIVVCIVLSQLLTRTLIEPIERMAKNMDSVQEKPVYKEIAPFAEKSGHSMRIFLLLQEADRILLQMYHMN